MNKWMNLLAASGLARQIESLSSHEKQEAAASLSKWQYSSIIGYYGTKIWAMRVTLL